MNEELLKLNTDCVYFLASPLTCKKGIECEYRHSEIARLNPRECWYWLSGSCLNPTCAFRHPPLDGYTGEASELAMSSVPVNNTNVPCYYYFNGYCNKGERCLFLHDTDSEEPHGAQVVKTTTANSEVPHFENNTFAGSDLGSALANGHSKPSTTTKVEVDKKVQPKQEIQLPALKEAPNQSISPQICVSQDEETTPQTEPYSSPPEAGFVHSISYAHKSLGSDELMHEQIDRVGFDEEEVEREERWESSPGFDVLVDGEEKNLESEDGQEYVMARREPNGRFSGYDFENPVEYDPSYPDLECRYVSEIHHRHNPNGNDDVFCDVKNVPGQYRERMIDSVLHHERRLVTMDLGYDNHKHADLRDRLCRARFTDGFSFRGLSRTHKTSQPFGASQSQRHGRLASEVGRNRVELLGKGVIYAKKDRFKKLGKEKRSAKRQRLSSKITKERSPNESKGFSGPKTLAQIKEEKRAAEEIKCNSAGENSKRKSRDFEGPKPLSEILKEKGKL